MWKIEGFFPSFIIFKMVTTFEVSVVCHIFFNLVDNPFSLHLKASCLWSYIYQKTCIFRKNGEWCSWFFLNNHMCGQENCFQNRSTEDFSMNNHLNHTLSITQTKLHQARNILLLLIWHKCTIRSDGTGLRSLLQKSFHISNYL